MEEEKIRCNASHVTCQTLGQTQRNLNLRLSEFGLGALKFLQSYTLVFAPIHSCSAASCRAVQRRTAHAQNRMHRYAPARACAEPPAAH